MALTDATNRLKSLDEEFRALLISAGVPDAAIEKAFEGRFIPCGAMGVAGDGLSAKQKNVLYFDSEHDDASRKVRKLVFNIQDLSLRQQIIKKRREREALLEAMSSDEIARKQRELDNAKIKLERPPWLKAAVVAGCVVVVGWYFFGTPGAIGGALVGYFLGQREIAIARATAYTEIRATETELADLQESQEEDGLRPRFFSGGEAVSGEQDNDFQREDAFTNRMQQYFHKA